MADQLIRDRQDAPIWNAIEASNFKQALKLVDKRLAKKHTDYLEALKIYIRSRSPLLSEKSAVLIHLEESVGRKPPLADPEAIELYDEALGEVLPDTRGTWEKTIGEVRWQCVKTTPKNEDFSLKCFEECIANDDLDHARQISNSLEKTFPNNHAYVFWNISTMFLYSISSKYPEAQRQLWGRLALGQIGKLAAATKQAADPKKLPTRSIHTPQELLLLHRITEQVGKNEQRLEFLQDPHLGPESAVAKGEWQLWRFKLKLMEAAKQWQELFDITNALLERARTKDESGQIKEPRMSDWIVWDAFIRSAVELPGHKQKGKVLAEVESHLDPDSGIDKSWRRNASLAWMKFCFETATPFSVIPDIHGKGQVLNRIPIVFKYLQKYGDASTAYEDLRPFVERMDTEERAQLLNLLVSCKIFEDSDEVKDGGSQPDEYLSQYLSTPKKITQVVNTYKLRYLLVSGLPERERTQSPLYKPGRTEFQCPSCSKPCGRFCDTCLKRVAQDAIESYQCAIDDDGRITKTLLTTDRHPADDFCVIAAMCLIKLSLMHAEDGLETLRNIRISYILQATSLLEYAWTHSKSNFQISLLLIRLHCYLGCGSLAMRAYQRLSLKQTQFDTLSYTLFDRISSFHPHPFGHSPDGSTQFKTAVEHLQKQQKLYRTARDHVTKNVWTSFKHGSYNSIFEIREVSETLSHTLSGAMSVIESSKVSRLTEKTPLTAISGGYDILPRNLEDPETTLTDTNDYGTFPNFESSQGPRFERLSRFMPAPSAYRYRANLAAEKLMQIVDPASEKHGGNAADFLRLKQHVVSNGQNNSGSQLLTWSETLAKQTYDDMGFILREPCDKELWSEDDFQDKLDAHNKNLCEGLEQHVALVSGLHDVVPAFQNTLHALYIAHEVGRAVLNFSDYFARHGKEVHQKQIEASKQIAGIAQKLLQTVVDKCAVIKKGLDEGGWIDKVLESTLPDAQEGETSAVLVLRDLIDENFMEELAGLVVESWRDSIVGLSCLKASAKA